MASYGGIAIKDTSADIIRLYENVFGYNDFITETTFHDYEIYIDTLFGNYLDKAKNGIILRGVEIFGEWTIIIDPELIDWVENEKLEEISSEKGANVFSFMAETTSSSYAFSIYKNTLLRSFISIDGEIQTDFGEPLPEEKGVNINGLIFSDDIIELASNLGLNLLRDKSKKEFVIREWKY